MPASGVKSFKWLFELQAVPRCRFFFFVLGFVTHPSVELFLDTPAVMSLMSKKEKRIVVLTINSFSWSLMRDMGPSLSPLYYLRHNVC